MKKRIYIDSGTFAMKGMRPTMEDEHISFDDLEQDYPSLLDHYELPLAYYGIYDGHRGIRAAEYAAEHLHTNILEHKDFLTDTKKAITEAFLQTDDDFLEKARKQEEKWNDGCTAVVAIILGTKVYIANCGDAEILLGRKKEEGEGYECIELTHKHKPSDAEEKERIKAAGGMVLAGRVGGALAVSRAFGDLEFKTPFQDGDLVIGKLITAEPFVASFDLIPDRDLFLIIGCDGVWERMGHQDSVNFVGKHLHEEGAEVMSEMLVNRAFSQKSQDNISCTIVSLNWGSPDDEEGQTENMEDVSLDETTQSSDVETTEGDEQIDDFDQKEIEMEEPEEDKKVEEGQSDAGVEETQNTPDKIAKEEGELNTEQPTTAPNDENSTTE